MEHFRIFWYYPAMLPLEITFDAKCMDIKFKGKIFLVVHESVNPRVF